MMSSKRLASNNNQVRKGYKKTAIGLIPEDWEVKDISAVCLLQRGFDITESTRKFGNVPVYSSSGLAYFHNQAKVNPPGVVTGRKGILGKVFYIEEPFWPHDTTLWIKDFKGNDAKYISFFLTYFNLERFDASTSVPTLNRNNLATISIPVPPLPEQKAIAQTLSDVDALIAALDKLIAKKRNIKTGTMQQLLTGKTRLPGFDKKWVIKPLGNIADKSIKWSFTGGPFGSNLKSCDYTEQGVQIIQLQNIGDGEFINNSQVFTSEIKADELLSCNIYPGDIILSKMGDPVARACIIPDINPRYLMCSDGIRLCVNKRESDSYFIYSYINSPYFRLLAENASTGSTRKRIGLDSLKKIELSIPPLPEQQAIASILSDMDSEITALEKRRAKTQAIKQGMMQELLTGRTRLINN
jgi:type I restriction enzyme S subunit